MQIYIFIYCIIFILGLLCFYKGETNNKKKIFLFVVFFVLFFVVAFRDESVGTDTIGYLNYVRWYRVRDAFFYRNLEIGYLLLMKICVLISKDDKLIFVVVGAITITNVAVFIYRQSNNVFFSTLVYVCLPFYFQTFNLTRQMLAGSILLIVYDVSSKKKYKQAVLLIFIAGFFHRTAFLGFIILLIQINKDVSTKKYILFLLSGLLLIPFGSFGINFFQNFISKYTYYEVELNVEFFGALAFIYLFIIVCALGLAFSKKNKISKEQKIKLFNLAFLITVALIINFLSIYLKFLQRSAMYFGVFAIILIPLVIEQFPRIKPLVYYGTSLCLLVYGLITLISNSGEIVPYAFSF